MAAGTRSTTVFVVGVTMALPAGEDIDTGSPMVIGPTGILLIASAAYDCSTAEAKCGTNSACGRRRS
jgi:hypothetical protein